jgi:hypothetical protein
LSCCSLNLLMETIQIFLERFTLFRLLGSVVLAVSCVHLI